MNRLVLLGTKYKQHFYDAGVDNPKGFQITLVLMGLFLLTVVSIGLSTPDKAMITFVVLALSFAFFPLIFPKDTE